jgi:hypothetical protein
MKRRNLILVIGLALLLSNCVPIGQINTLGWLDSAFISPDGEELYFSYMMYAMNDYLAIVAGEKTEEEIELKGPARPGNHGTLYLETYRASKNADGTWGIPINLNVNGAYSLFSAKTSFDGTKLYYASDSLPGNLGAIDIYYSSKLPDGNWSPPTHLGASINTPYNEDQPCLTPDGDTMYFARNELGYGLGWEIMRSFKVNGAWTLAEKLGPPINEPNPGESANHQPFITADGNEMYFTRGYQIYKSVLQPDYTWGEPVRIFERVSGHASVTADGSELYFISYADQEALERGNITAWFSTRQPDGSWGDPEPVD